MGIARGRQRQPHSPPRTSTTTALTAEYAENAENDNLWMNDNREQSAVSKVAPCLAFSAYSAVDAVVVRLAWIRERTGRARARGR